MAIGNLERLILAQTSYSLSLASCRRIDVHSVKRESGQGYIFWPSPPPLGGNFCPNWKTGKNLKDFKKGKEKGEKEEKRSDKTHVKITLWSLNTTKKSTKTGKNFRGGGGKNFSGWPEYIPLSQDKTYIPSTLCLVDISRELVAQKQNMGFATWFQNFEPFNRRS